MNYFLLLIVLGVCGWSYYEHQQDGLQHQQDVSQLDQDKQQLAGLQQQLADAKAEIARHHAAPVTISAMVPVLPDNTHSSAIDAAASSATQASASANTLGTITTLDGRTFQDCKILKVEADGVTFSHSDGITKVLFPLMPPPLQQRFGYDPQKAVAQTEAQIRYQQQTQAAAQPTATATSAPAPATP